MFPHKWDMQDSYVRRSYTPLFYIFIFQHDGLSGDTYS